MKHSAGARIPVWLGVIATAVTLVALPAGIASADSGSAGSSSGSAGSSSGSASGSSDWIDEFPSGPLPAPRGPATAIVVLGYGLLPDGAMRPELVERLQAGCIQALLAPASPVILTGGNARNGVTEAQAMGDWFVSHGISADRIHLEQDAQSTVDNADNSAAIIREIGARDAVVVTSADHIARAVRTFIEAGVNVVGTVTPEQVPRFDWLYQSMTRR
ncbi:YdcF family protein [Nocardia sp. NPDC006630]|uniref:YdcF family protein n=1 Tax=Nocardia sp. NPDC006630 TaxID=3157181 RepID=UPI0033BA3178